MIRLGRRLCCLALLLPTLAWADMVVIVHPQFEAASLSRREIINIFMGRFRFLPSGQAIKPYDLPTADPKKGRFYRVLTGKDLSDIDAHWARLVLTGNASPPDETLNAEGMIEAVAHNPRAIGYVDRAQVDRRVRILFEPEK